MGALLTAFQGRISAERRKNLTNADVTTATSENTTISGYAETDVSSTFLHMTGVAFDATDAEHIAIGVKGMLYFLYTYKGLPLDKAGEAAKRDWESACERFTHTRGALAWQSPITDSTLAPSRDPAGALPYFDRKNISDMIPRPPNRGTADDPRDVFDY